MLLSLIAALLAPPGGPLTYAPQAQTHRYLQTVDAVMTVGRGSTASTTKSGHELVFEQTIGARKGASIPVALTFEAVRTRMLDDDGTELWFDTTTPEPGPNDAAIRAYLKRPYRFAMDPLGNPTAMPADAFKAGSMRWWATPLPASPVAAKARWTWTREEQLDYRYRVKVDGVAWIDGRDAVHGVQCTRLRFERQLTLLGANPAITFETERGALCFGDDGRPLRQQLTNVMRGPYNLRQESRVTTTWLPPGTAVPWTLEPAAPPAAPAAPEKADAFGDLAYPGAIRLGTERRGFGPQVLHLEPAPVGHAMLRVSEHAVTAFDPTDGRIIRRLAVPCVTVVDASWDAKGERIVVGCTSYDDDVPMVFVWGPEGEQPIRALTGPRRTLVVAFAGADVLAADERGRLWRWGKGSKGRAIVADPKTAARKRDNDSAFERMIGFANGDVVLYGERGLLRITRAGRIKRLEPTKGDNEIFTLGHHAHGRGRIALAAQKRVGVYDVRRARWVRYGTWPGEDAGPSVVGIAAATGQLFGWNEAQGLRLFKVAGKGYAKPTAPTFKAKRLVVTSDARYLVGLGPSDGMLRIYDRDAKRPVELGNGHATPLHAATASPDGARLATVGELGDVIVWQTADGSVTDRWQLPLAPNEDDAERPWIAWGGARLLAGDRRGAFALAGKGEPRALGQALLADELALSRDGTWAVGWLGRALKGWQFAGETPSARWTSEVDDDPCVFEFSADGSHFIVGFHKRLELRATQTGARLKSWPSDGCAGAMTADGARVAIATESAEIQVIEVKSGAILHAFRPQRDPDTSPRGMGFDKTGRVLAVLTGRNLDLFALDDLKPAGAGPGASTTASRRVIRTDTEYYYARPTFIGDRLAVRRETGAVVFLFDGRL